MCAFNLQSSTDVCFQEFLNPFCEEAEKAFSQPNASISQIAVNLRLKHETNVSFRLPCLVFAYLRESNLSLDSESEKHVASPSYVLICQSILEETRFGEISASKTKTEQPNKTAFTVFVQLTEFNWCVFPGVSKPFLRSSGKRIFPDKCKHFLNSWKSPSKTQNERILQTSLLCARLTKGVESAFRFRGWEARSF